MRRYAGCLTTLGRVADVSATNGSGPYLFPACVIMKGRAGPRGFSRLTRRTCIGRLLRLLIDRLNHFTFRTHGSTIILFGTLIHEPINSQAPAMRCVYTRPTLVTRLLENCRQRRLTLGCKVVLERYLGRRTLTRLYLKLPRYSLLFSCIRVPAFSVTSSTFTALGMSFLSLVSWRDGSLLSGRGVLITSRLVGGCSRFFTGCGRLLLSRGCIAHQRSLGMLPVAHLALGY